MDSLYFKRKEFACKCGCGFAAVDVDLLQVLEDLREVFLNPININSGCRCENYNKKVGGKKDSYHIKGMAADIKVWNHAPSEIAEFLMKKYPDKYGIGDYKTFTHIDIRENKSRW